MFRDKIYTLFWIESVIFLEQKLYFTLMWPDYTKGRQIEADIKSGKYSLFNQDLLERDINLDMIINGMDIRNENSRYVKMRLMDMSLDDKIIKYRQDILKDFMEYKDIEQGFDSALLPMITRLQEMKKSNISHNDNSRKTAWRIEMLKIYVQCVDALHDLICDENKKFKSEGMCKFRTMINDIYDTDGYRDLKTILPDLYQKLQTMKSVVIGINLDNELRPTEAVLLSLEEKPFKQKGLVASILGLQKNDENYYGIGSFYSILKDNKANSLDIGIMRDLESVMKDTFKHLAEVLTRFEWIETEFLFELLPEVYYYIGGIRLADKLKNAGLPVCFPTPASKEERIFRVNDMYDASFALRIMSDIGLDHLENIVVCNDAEMSDDAGRIFILTGANQGGKTTFTRAIGICQLLFQAGFPIPGTGGTISPVDNIYTHFPELEKNSISEGRLGEECIRLETVLPRLSKYSMILMNESLSSTSHQECLFIAEEIMRYLRKIGARCVFATHIHELAENIPTLNKEPALSDMVSLVAGVDEGTEFEVLTEEGRITHQGSKRTYKIRPMPPQGKSFALDIAKSYGISFEQLCKTHDEKYSEN
ncbi:MAG: hypothetical protein E7387_07030 [Ruminococcaceae bacterium]|nr:hypothetical protein [Oscillospiraceae bacterium]